MLAIVVIIGKEEDVKASLFENDMVACISNPKNLNKNLKY